MESDGEGQRESEARRRKAGEVKETLSISIDPQVRQAIDKEIEEGLWANRSQAISHYICLGREVEKCARELAVRRISILHAINQNDREKLEIINEFLTLSEDAEVRRWLAAVVKDGLDRE